MNHSTRVSVATMGAVFGLSGMSHGFFGALQGNLLTPGLFVSAIDDPEAILGVMLACLLAVVLLLPLAFVSGFARDLDAIARCHG